MNIINNAYVVYESGKAIFEGGQKAFSFSNIITNCHSILSGRWLGQVVTSIPLISHTLIGVNYIVSLPSEKLAHWIISRSIKRVVKFRLTEAYNASYKEISAIFTHFIFGETAFENVTKAFNNPLTKKFVEFAKTTAEAKFIEKIQTLVLETLDPLVIAGGANAIGNFTACATTGAIQLYIGSQVEQTVLAQIESNFPEIKSELDALNEWNSLKSKMLLTAALVSLSVLPLAYRRCCNTKAIKYELKKNLVDQLYAKIVGEASGLITASILKSMLDEVVETILSNTLIDIHLLKAAYDKSVRNCS